MITPTSSSSSRAAGAHATSIEIHPVVFRWKGYAVQFERVYEPAGDGTELYARRADLDDMPWHRYLAALACDRLGQEGGTRWKIAPADRQAVGRTVGKWLRIDTLPPPLYAGILSRCDARDILNLASVNRRAHDSLHPYCARERQKAQLREDASRCAGVPSMLSLLEQASPLGQPFLASLIATLADRIAVFDWNKRGVAIAHLLDAIEVTVQRLDPPDRKHLLSHILPAFAGYLKPASTAWIFDALRPLSSPDRATLVQSYFRACPDGVALWADSGAAVPADVRLLAKLHRLSAHMRRPNPPDCTQVFQAALESFESADAQARMVALPSLLRLAEDAATGSVSADQIACLASHLCRAPVQLQLQCKKQLMDVVGRHAVGSLAFEQAALRLLELSWAPEVRERLLISMIHSGGLGTPPKGEAILPRLCQALERLPSVSVQSLVFLTLECEHVPGVQRAVHRLRARLPPTEQQELVEEIRWRSEFQRDFDMALVDDIAPIREWCVFDR